MSTPDLPFNIKYYTQPAVSDAMDCVIGDGSSGTHSLSLDVRACVLAGLSKNRAGLYEKTLTNFLHADAEFASCVAYLYSKCLQKKTMNVLVTSKHREIVTDGLSAFFNVNREHLEKLISYGMVYRSQDSATEDEETDDMLIYE